MKNKWQAFGFSCFLGFFLSEQLYQQQNGLDLITNVLTYS